MEQQNINLYDNMNKPLSQMDLANGWNLIIPKKKEILKTSTTNKKQYNTYHIKVNLAQLPFKLWNKYKNNRFTNETVHINIKSHHYVVTPTVVDNIIIELVNILNKPYEELNTVKVINLTTILTNNNIRGWPVILANIKYNMSN